VTLVVDAVVHPYNLSAENAVGPIGGMVRHAFGGLHAVWNPPDVQVPPELYLTDQRLDDLVKTLFVESDTDLAVYHTLRLDSLFHDGLCSFAKCAEALDRWPGRFVGYAGVDPTLGVDVALRDLERQVAELPGLVGVKVYPDQVDPYRTWRMDDPEVAFPLWRRAAELGLRSIAVHKALPNGPVPLDPYRIADLEGAAMAFPQMTFEIVHAGMAFVEETAHALARFPNVYASLEVTASLLLKAPGLFEDVLAQFLFWGGAGKVLWSTGANFSHPQPLIDAFRALELSDATRHRYGLAQLTEAEKAQILGGTYLRLMGLEDHAVPDDGLRRDPAAAPFSHWKAEVAA